MRLTRKPKRKQRKEQACDLSRFLRRTGYPFATEWSPSALASCQTHVLPGPDGYLGAVWFQPISPSRTNFHIHISPALRGRWLTPRVFRYLIEAARSTGFPEVLAYPLPQHIQFVLRIGFVPIGNGWYSLDLRNQ
ncbi:hypothetical protein SAMN03159494_03575 [Achromobacter sp. NFACC18-2]|nr:hypothetical protein SAMN03159494_03575 [Achromobacter sp. NFACC18-2]